MTDAFTKTTLNYPQNADTPIKRVRVPRAPTTGDYRNFVPGDEWLDSSSNDWWKLVSTQTGNAVWVRIGGTPGNVATLTGNSGGAVGPDAAHNINVLGTAGQIVVAGNAGTNTLTLSLAGGGTGIDSFTPDAGTSPVVPDGAGNVTMTGGNGVITTGGLNTLTFDMQSPFTGDFTFTKATAGATELLTSSNTDNTAANASSAAVVASVGGTTQIGDPYFLAAVGAARSYAFGADTTDSQILKINTTNAASVTPSSGTNLWAMTSGGSRIEPLQPAFLGIAADALDVTGTGTLYQYGTAPMSEVYDQGSNFTTAGVFTAPVTGKMFLQAGGYLQGCTINTDCSLRLITSNRTYQSTVARGASNLDSAAQISVAADMDAADTAVCSIFGNGEAGDTDDLLGTSGGVTLSYFSGYLAC